MLTKTVSAWLQRINQPESWLSPKLSELADQTRILDRDIFISRIAKEIKAGGLIALASDYDVDGISAGVILTEVIRACGGRATHVMSSRFDGGYGLSMQMVQRVLALSPKLVVTCDFGSSDHERLQLLKDSGVDTLVLDHHLVPEKPLPTLAFLNPHRPECKSEERSKNMCSGGLAWSVAGGLLKELGLSKEISHTQWLDLAGLATISDVMSLSGDNRSITRAGLDTISKAERPGIRALLAISKITPGTFFSGRDVAFRLSPAINAPGRLNAPDIVSQLLMSKDMEEATSIAEQIKEIWDKRRIITDEITHLCEEQVLMNEYDRACSIVVGNDSYGHGIVGISAARLVDKFKVPVCVIGHEGRGSLRGPPGSRLYDALVHCKNTLLRFGGHQAAAGCQVDFNNLSAFRQKFCEFFQQNPPIKPADQFDPILDLNLQDSLLAVADDINKCEPCGQGNPRPLIRTTGTVINWKQVKGLHIKFDLKLKNGRELPCFQIGNGETQETRLGQTVTVTGDLRKNTWNGRTKAEMFVETINMI